jgi:hypothetical protein
MIQVKKISIRLVFLIFFILIITLGAMKFYWYQAIWWFDMPMHFLGGVVIVFLLAYFFRSYLSMKEVPQIINFLLLGVVIIGVGWEVFEYIFYNIIAGKIFIISDSLSDIFFATAGAITGIFLVKNKI